MDNERCSHCDKFAEKLTTVEGYTGTPCLGHPTAGYLCDKCLDELGIDNPGSNGCPDLGEMTMWINLKEGTRAMIVPNGLVIWNSGQLCNVPCTPEKAKQWVERNSGD